MNYVHAGGCYTSMQVCLCATKPLKSDILSGGLQLYSGTDVVCMLELVVEVFVAGRGTVQ